MLTTRFASRSLLAKVAQRALLKSQAPALFIQSASYASTPARFETGTVEKTLSALDMSVVRQIKAELMAVDVNSDGRIDAGELKELLRKHHNAFTDNEIVEIGDLYYAGKAGAGGSVSFDRFIEAVDRAAALSPNKAGWETEDKHPHFKDSGRHPLGVGRDGMEFYQAGKGHGHYTAEELNVKLTHVPPVGIRDQLAFNAVKAVRFLFDGATGWRNDNITIPNIMNRVIYLETIAAVPGMVAAIIRHFSSLRNMTPDGGLLQMFLEEANNERMHLLTFVRMKNPGRFFKLAVIGGQFGFGLGFLTAYMISPKFCHRFVGYVEEEACATYTKIIHAIEEAPEGSELVAWKTEHAPPIAKAYWKLGEEGSILDLMYAVRADEAEHRDVNHLVCGMKEGQVNPLYDPESKLDAMLVKYVRDIMENNPNAKV
jgi:demethoxyubiquinone hydroxylase (CLK1/Coq7/Cat5 family)